MVEDEKWKQATRREGETGGEGGKRVEVKDKKRKEELMGREREVEKEKSSEKRAEERMRM